MIENEKNDNKTKIEILFEDEHCIVVNKPALLLTHPSKETKEKENLLFQVRDQIDNYLYPIHRLDRQTSGIVIFGKSPEFIRELQQLWHSDQVRKKYIALINEKDLQSGCYALKSDKGHFQEAKTSFEVIKHFNDTTLIEAEIFTGRRHQIRRHFARRMQHIVGDRKYGKKKMNDFYLENFGLKRLFLHSHQFIFFHPLIKEVVTIDCPIPDELTILLKNLK
jgi:tRNA pseudouridine65 synthase